MATLVTRRETRLSLVWLATLAALLLPLTAGALEPTDKWEGAIDYAATGGTFLEDTCQATVFGCLPGKQDGQGDMISSTSTAQLCNIPDDANIVKATLVWMGTLSDTSLPDDQVTLTPPQGADYPVVAAATDLVQTEYAGKDVNDNAATFRYYTYRVDVTDVLRKHYLTNKKPLNGSYTVSNYSGYSDEPYKLMKAVVGGWSLLIIYSSATGDAKRIYFYTDFRAIRDDKISLTPTGFQAPQGAKASATFFVGEGDPEISGMGTGVGVTHTEELRFNNVLLTDSCNPADNPYNSTISTNLCSGEGACRKDQYSVDLDYFDVSNLMHLGDTSATVDMSVGQDLILTNFIILAITSKAPDFDIPDEPEKAANPEAGTSLTPGQTYTYYIYVQNSGEDVAANVKVRDKLQSDLSYVADSTYITAPDGTKTQVADGTGGTAPFAEPMLVAATLPPGRDYRYTVEFKVRLHTQVEGVTKETIIDNTGEIISGSGDVYFTNGGLAVRHTVSVGNNDGVLYFTPGPKNPASRFISGGGSQLPIAQIHIKVLNGTAQCYSLAFAATSDSDRSMVTKGYLYIDENHNGTVDFSDTSLGSATFDGSFLTFSHLGALSSFFPGDEYDVLLLVDVASTTALGSSVQFSLSFDNMKLLGQTQGLPFETARLSMPAANTQLTLELGEQSLATSYQTAGSTLPVMQLKAHAYADGITISSLKADVKGTLTYAYDVSKIELYLDANGNGKVDAGETLLATGSYDAGSGEVTFSPLSQAVAKGSDVTFVIQTSFSSAVTPGSTFWLDIASADMVDAGGMTVVGTPVTSNTITFADTTTACTSDADCASLGTAYTCNQVSGLCEGNGTVDGDDTSDTDIPDGDSDHHKKGGGCRTTDASAVWLLAGLAALAWRRRSQRI